MNPFLMDLELEHGSIKHLETHPKVVDGGGGSSELSKIDTDVVDQSGSRKHSRTDLEDLVDWNGVGMHSTIHPEVIDRSGSSETSATHLEDKTVDEGDRPATTKKLASQSSASSSSSSSDSSLEKFFQVNINKINSRTDTTTASTKPNEDAQPEKNNDEIVVLSKNISSKSEDPDNGSSTPPTSSSRVLIKKKTSSSQVSDLIHESIFPSMSPAHQSPPVQVMERYSDYDPNRIPSSVFASKPTTPLEWSVASNESLFSIHVGNNSFSRDHFIMFGGDIRKSQELAKSSELILFSPPPPVTIVETDRKSVDTGINFGASRSRIADESVRDCTNKKADVQCEEKVHPQAGHWNSGSVSNHSDGSGGSTQSFAFPIKKKCAWPFCYCSNCSCRHCSWPSCHCSWPRCRCPWPRCRCPWPSCHCSWPRCRCPWPSCHCSRPKCRCSWPSCHCPWPSCHCLNCSQGFCYSWNCSRKRFCCFTSTSTILADGVKSGSVKVEDEPLKGKNRKTPSSKGTSKCCCACNWFSCFSWRPRCCSCSCGCC